CAELTGWLISTDERRRAAPRREFPGARSAEGSPVAVAAVDAERPKPRARMLRDADRTQAAILAAATQEFARYGLGGARVDRIAARAKNNKRMLYYYFGNKEALFRAVLERAYARIRAAEKNLQMLDAPPVEGVRRLVEFTWGYYLANPEFMTLLNSEN